MHHHAKCPVCGTDLGDAIPDFCPTCGWECSTDITLFPSLTPLHGSDWDYYQRKLIQARERWTKTQDEIAKLAKAQADLEKKLKEARSISGVNKQKSVAFNRTTEQTRQKIKDIEFDKRPLVSTSPEMVFVEGGSFLMGSEDGNTNERPVHRVELSSFYIGKYLVTQNLWEEVMGTHPSHFKDALRPVEQISWYQAVIFCNKLSLRDRLPLCYSLHGEVNQKEWDDRWQEIECDFDCSGYRLPTEAEWEFAARGGNKSKGYRYSGSDELGMVAWYKANSNTMTHPVGEKMANELNIFDMTGNVYEWCWDWSIEYDPRIRINPKGPHHGYCRIRRGGAYWDVAFSCHVATRNCDADGSKTRGCGLRLARTCS